MEPVAIISVDVHTIRNDPALGSLLAEYAHECKIAGLPSPNPNWDTYERLENAGALVCLAACKGNALVGFMGLLISDNPHYGVRLAISESFFVAAAYRSTGAGLRLLRAAEDIAERERCTGMLVSSPDDGRLAEVLPRTGYRQSNVVFFKGLR